MKINKLEQTINKWCEHINSLGYFATKMHCLRSFKGAYIKGEPFDYIFITPFVHFFFDTKECNKDKWYFSNTNETQLSNLSRLNDLSKGNKIKAGFLIYYKQHDELRFYNMTIITDYLNK